LIGNTRSGHPRKKIPFATEPLSEPDLYLWPLATVCHESRCPNQAECAAQGVFTALVMGNVCTRHCAYCDIRPGRPLPLDPEEKNQVRDMCRKLDTRHLVLTSVTRDDLPDGGACHIVDMVNFLKKEIPAMKVEFLLPDFSGQRGAWELIRQAPLDVFAHNIEIVPRLFAKIRPQGDWRRSLDLLSFLAQKSGSRIKSGFMVGLGETDDEVFLLLDLLIRHGVSFVTIGQYLPPTKNHPEPIMIPMEKFRRYRDFAINIGFSQCLAAPFVRSSYMAHQIWG